MRFQWLKDYQELDEQLTYLKWNLNKSQLELSRWVSGDLVDIKLSKNSRSAKLEENILTICQEIERLESQKKELLVIVESFSGLENQIIKLKYVEGKTLEEISEELGYSASHIRAKHAEVKRAIRFLDGYEERQQKTRDLENEKEHYGAFKNVRLFAEN